MYAHYHITINRIGGFSKQRNIDMIKEYSNNAVWYSGYIQV